MATPKPNNSFLTPSKLELKNNHAKRYTSAISNPLESLGAAFETPTVISPQPFGPQNLKDDRNPQKAQSIQYSTSQLRYYSSKSPQTDKKQIRYIHKSHNNQTCNVESQQMILKDISIRVKDLIKDSQNMKQHNHEEDILVLKNNNKDLQTIINQFRSHPNHVQISPMLQNQASSDNKRLDQSKYAQQITQKNQNSSPNKQEQRHSIFNRSIPFSLPTLKKEMMAYINTVIQSNDQKLQKQKRYIESLQGRVARLDQFESKIEHLNFEKTVKLQESNRKGKIFSLKTPQIMGDRSTDENLQFSPKANQPQQYYFTNPYKINKQYHLVQQFTTLSQQYSQLKQQFEQIQRKYDLEMENHIRDTTEKQSFINYIEELNLEKKDLKRQNFHLSQRLKLNQYKLNSLQSYILNWNSKYSGKINENIGFTISNELISIKNQLKTCFFQRFEIVERQIAGIVIERDYLKNELTHLAQGSKFSSMYKQIFFLKQKNSQLQRSCQFYQQKIAKYVLSGLIPIQNSPTQVKQAMPSRSQGLEWVRDVYLCILDSINRLQNIQKQVKGKSKI